MIKILNYQFVGNLTLLKKTYLPVLNQILRGNLTKSEKTSRIHEFQIIVDCIIVLFESLSRVSLTVLLDTSRTIINRKLHTLHFVLKILIDPTNSVRLFHLSFRDILIDSEHKDSQFSINEKETHKKLTFRCLDLLSITKCLKEDICSLKKFESLRINIDDHVIKECLPAKVQYACRYWAHHLERGNCRISDQDKVHKFLNQRFFY